MKYKMISFDLDGVIFTEKDFWARLHHAYGTVEEGRALTEKYLKTDFKKLVDEVIGRLWKGQPADKYYETVKAASYNPGVKETFAKLKQLPIKTAIISSSVIDLVKRAQKELQVDYAFGNEMVIKDNKISGEFIDAHDFHGKGLTLKRLCTELGISPADVIAVGDNANDISKFKVAGFSIAFNSKCDELNQIADVVIDSNDLRMILPYIK